MDRSGPNNCVTPGELSMGCPLRAGMGAILVVDLASRRRFF